MTPSKLAKPFGTLVALLAMTAIGAGAEEARLPITPNPLDVSPGVTMAANRESPLAAGPGDLGLSVFVVAQDCGPNDIFDGLRIAAVNPSVLRGQARARNGVRVFYDGPLQPGQFIRIPVREFVWTGFTRDGDDNFTAVRAGIVCRPQP